MLVLRRFSPVLLCLGLLGASWLGLSALCEALRGPAGFTVVAYDRDGRVVSRSRTPYLLSPDVVPPPPPGGGLRAETVLLARRQGEYEFNLGATGAPSLFIDGQEVPWRSSGPGKSGIYRRDLGAGPHLLEVRLRFADDEGGLVLGMRPPGAGWRSRLLGPGDAVALPLPEVIARLGRHGPLLCAALPWVPAAGSLLVLGLLCAVTRRRLPSYLRELLADPRAPRLLSALAILALVLPVIWPLTAPGYYACHEEESYIVRMAQYDTAIRGGVPMGRWWPDPVLGRGYPFLCLYAPLLYLLAAPLLLLGMGPLTTVKLLSAATIGVAALALYGLVRRRASRPAALVAVAMLLSAPYLDNDIFVRADLAEALGFATFPLALWALDRALDRDHRDFGLRVACLGLALGALGICHNITSYFSLFFLALWLVLRVALGTADLGRGGRARVLLGGGLAILLTVFFIVPALVDRDLVWSERITRGWYSYKNNFVDISRVFVATRFWDMRLYLGGPALAALLLAPVGLLVALRRWLGRGDRGGTPAGTRELLVLGLGGVLLAVALITRRFGLPFYRTVPLAKYITFPWRMFLFGACLAPLLAAAAVDGLLPAGRWRRVGAGLAIGIIMALSLGESGPRGPLLRKHLHVERFLRSLDVDYVTSMNEYLPRTVQRTVPFFGPVAHLLGPGGAPGPAAEIEAASRSAGRYQARVRAAAPAEIEFNAHWFPGWQATLDGRPVAIGPRGAASFDGGGLIRVPVPAGAHDIQLVYGRTRLRLFADALSLAALGGTLLMLVRGWLRRRLRGAPAAAPDQAPRAAG